jgi:hypothetical protein
MKFITVGRFVINANLIMSIEVYRPGNGSDVKVSGQVDNIKSHCFRTDSPVACAQGKSVSWHDPSKHRVLQASIPINSMRRDSSTW